MRLGRWLILALALVALAPPATASADLGPPYASADGGLDTAPTSTTAFLITGPVDPIGHANYLMRVTVTRGATRDGSAGSVWWEFPPQTRAVAPGGAPDELVVCDVVCSEHVEWFDVPSAPATFAGTATAFGLSYIGFVAPVAGNYHLDVVLAAGSATVFGPGPCPNLQPTRVAASGRVELGHLAAGITNFCIESPDGTGATWQATVARDPLTVSAAVAARSLMRSGDPTNVTFTASDSGAVDELVERTDSGAAVRTIQTGAAVAEGANTVAWDGRDDHGNPVPDGVYSIVAVSRDDPLHGTAATVDIDNTRPHVLVKGRQVSQRFANVHILAGDASGISHGEVAVAGASTNVLRFARDGLAYHPRRGWRTGRNALRVKVTDRAGNVTTVAFSIDLKPKRR